ncbi:phospho-N-acetylmuramoyl-pentapeptide-transferase [bacterium]|nr:phospho-N-acetylmuramoyl-pentapeptide-transferase [bacterium]
MTHLSLLTFNTIKVMSLSASAAIVAILWTPFLTYFLYKYKLWKKKARNKTITGEEATVFYNLHKERETKTPRFGGLLIWITSSGIIFLFWILSRIFSQTFLRRFDILSRKETWLPLFALIAASIVGLLDDILQVTEKGKYIGGGMTFKKRLFIIILIGLVGGWWFFYKLGWNTIHIPLFGDFFIGIWYIPLFILVMVASWSGGIIDGVDGLAGGVFASIFGAFAIIAFSQGKIDLASFCAVIVGTLFAFLWFNIPPARFYMGETGILGLTSAMTVVAFLTDSVAVLPIIAGLLVLESGSVIIQLLSKKIFKRKIFLCTPIHHHFEAKGWPSYKVTMRFWIIGVVLALIGVVIRLLG